jgi:hypothetical protein
MVDHCSSFVIHETKVGMEQEETEATEKAESSFQTVERTIRPTFKLNPRTIGGSQRRELRLTFSHTVNSATHRGILHCQRRPFVAFLSTSKNN